MEQHTSQYPHADAAKVGLGLLLQRHGLRGRRHR
jgi:hypothetical protein